MPVNTVHGTGRQWRDETYNRVIDLMLKGQAIPLGGFYSGSMARLMTASPRDLAEVNIIHPDSGLGLIICGKSTCGGPDVCG